jgi:haloalkane dehalogenase
VPAQILWGAQDKDGFPLEMMNKWQGYLKLHETEVLEDASHYVQEDRPDRVAAAIRRAIQRTQQSYGESPSGS